MGMIIKNGVEYNFGSSNTDSSSMEIVTQAEYDALVANGTMDNDKYYFITDTSVSENATASDIPYDNTESGLEATDVQGAVDELNQNMQKVKTYVGPDGKLHFVDASGADTVLNFSAGKFVGVGSIASLKASDSDTSLYTGCAIDEEYTDKCKYVIFQTNGRETERYFYTTKSGATLTSLGNNTYEYICGEGESFTYSASTYGSNTILLRQANKTVPAIITMCKFLPSKPTS